MAEDGRYPESRQVQQPALDWLRSARGYRELFSDIGAVGARMDSTGLLDGRLVMVEVKVRIDAKMVRFVSDRPGGTIEAKISGTLRNVALGSEDDLTRVIIGQRPLAARPVIAILSREYGSGGIDELAVMLAEHAPEWQFDWEIWEWTGERIETLRSGAGAGAGFPPADRIPAQVPPPGRRTKGSLERLRTIAERNGVLDLFETGIAMAEAAGLKRLAPTASNQNFAWTGPDGKRLNVFGLYPTYSSAEHGLNVGICVDGVPSGATPPASLVPAPATGFLNTNLYARGPEDLAALLACFREPEAAHNDGETP